MIFATGAVLYLAVAPTALHAGGRVALVVGNSAYRTVAPLPNPRNDAFAMIERLRQLGFTTIGGIDLTQEQFAKALDQFRTAIAAGGVGLFYYSGHGVQLEGENYLFPVDSNVTSTTRSIKSNLIALDDVLAAMNRKNGTNLLFIDACRNNPFAPAPTSKAKSEAAASIRSSKSARGLARLRRGLARVDVGAGTMITFATQPGNVALDGDGDHSPFAAALLKYISLPGADIAEMLRRVRSDVVLGTGGKQVPWSNSSLLENFYFSSPPERDRKNQELASLRNEIKALKDRLAHSGSADFASKSADQQQLLSLIDELRAREKQRRDEAAFVVARTTDSISSYRSYLSLYREGQHRKQATQRISELRALEQDWKTLGKQRSFAALDDFIERSAGTEFEPYAVLRRSDVERQELDDWDRTEVERTQRAYTAFLARWPDGRLNQSASDRLEELARIGEEWNRLKTTTDVAALREFIDRDGWSEYGAEAVAVLASLVNPLARESETSGVKVLTASEIVHLIDHKKLVYARSHDVIAFDSGVMPIYRRRLGAAFLSGLLKEKFAAEGAFKANLRLDGKSYAIEGLGTVVESRVDRTGSIFLMQMHGNERKASDVNRRDRKYTAIQIINGPYGYVCVSTRWALISAAQKPKKQVDVCEVK